MLKIYNTKTRQKEEFAPICDNEVKMYVCGPTVYNLIHIGNARTFISFDMIRRYLMWSGFNVTYVQNVTDVDDKIIAAANASGESASDLASKYTQLFIEDLRAANVLDPDIRPLATQEIDSMIQIIAELIDGGFAYESEGDVYFSVRAFPAYGSLSGRDVNQMQSGHRELRDGSDEVLSRKRDSLDFAMWKGAKPGEPAWDSPWGSGRPGWHIECSAMSRKYLGLPFDIHGGGADLVFPHHENELAQSEAACSCTFANYWMHGGMLQINSEKMSKSLGNFLLLNEVLKTTSASVLRLLMFQTHYRSPLDFSSERLSGAASALNRIENLVSNLRWRLENLCDSGTVDATLVSAENAKLRCAFVEQMNDDFNSAGALGEIFAFVGFVNSQIEGAEIDAESAAALQESADLICELMGVFGVEVATDGECAHTEDSQGATKLAAELLALAADICSCEFTNEKEATDAIIAARAQARLAKNWALADEIRDRLASIGYAVNDTPQGARITKA